MRWVLPSAGLSSSEKVDVGWSMYFWEIGIRCRQEHLFCLACIGWLYRPFSKLINQTKVLSSCYRQSRHSQSTEQCWLTSICHFFTIVHPSKHTNLLNHWGPFWHRILHHRLEYPTRFLNYFGILLTPFRTRAINIYFLSLSNLWINHFC